MISLNPKCTNGQTSAWGWLYPWHPDPHWWLEHQSEQLPHTLESIAEGIEFNVWSPLVYQGSHRIGKEFVEAYYIGLDFDEGKTLEWAIETFRSYACIIGTTRNHQIVKDKKPACDRFRVVLRLTHRTTDEAVFKATVTNMIKRYSTDRSCKDVARFFYPCKEIIYIGPEDGCTIHLIHPKKPTMDFTASSTKAPERLGNALQLLYAGYGFHVGRRHDTVLAAAKSLLSFHKKTDVEAYSIIRPLTDKPEAEVIACIKYAKEGACA